MDFSSSFYQVPMLESDQYKTAFSTTNGHYEFTRSPMGFKTSPNNFQRMVDIALEGLIGKICIVFIDDVLIFSETEEEHLDHVRQVMERLEKASLKVNPEKCEFLKRLVSYVAHRISEGEVRPQMNKIKAVQAFPQPKTVKQI